MLSQGVRGYTAWLGLGRKGGNAGQEEAGSAQTAPRALWGPASDFSLCHRLSVCP